MRLLALVDELVEGCGKNATVSQSIDSTLAAISRRRAVRIRRSKKLTLRLGQRGQEVGLIGGRALEEVVHLEAVEQAVLPSGRACGSEMAAVAIQEAREAADEGRHDLLGEKGDRADESNARGTSVVGKHAAPCEQASVSVMFDLDFLQ